MLMTERETDHVAFSKPDTGLTTDIHPASALSNNVEHDDS
jgi:hypothetical protein